MKKIILISLYFFYFSGFSQNLQRSDLSFIENGFIVKSPLSGGLNSAQLSNIDLNNDGIKDLFVFERIGDRVLCFINDTENNITSFYYSKEYSYNFPKLYKWALLVDYNCDGKEDIFTYNDSYVKVYKNSSDGNNINFIEESNAIISDLGSIFSAIIISEVDIPSFVDVDFDGDIDVLTFKQSGGYIEYHQNQSMELYGNCDSLIFELKTDCWGKFFEGLNSYDFNSCSDNPIQYQYQIRSTGAHSGSSSLTLDIDGDNDMDIILGDVSFNNLNLLINGGDSENAVMNDLNQQFPIGNGSLVSADIESFPAAFYVDVNTDNIRDLVVSPNISNNAEDFESLKLFLNTGQDNNPNFEFTQSNFLQELTLDFGSSAYPAFIDYNNDGLKDLLIGNYGYHDNPNPRSQLALFRNIGSLSSPSFELIDRDFCNLSGIALDTALNTSVKGLKPTLGDLDGDGDKDLIVGDNNGKLHYFKNTAAIGTDAIFEIENVNFFSIDVGQHAAPFLFDMNGDNLLDLVIGQVNGTLSYAENTGTTNNPQFNTLLGNLGNVSVSNDESLYGFSIPFVFENNNQIEILVGSESGRVYHYNSINNNLSGTFNLLSDDFQNTKEGKNVAVLYEDFDNDSHRDLFFGMQSGGLFYYKNDGTSSYNSQNEIIDIEVFPNPTTSILNIVNKNEVTFTLFSLLGQKLFSQHLSPSSHNIDLSHLPPSCYLISFESNNKTNWERIIIKQ